MWVTAARELRLPPRDIALLGTGELLALSWSAEGMHLDAYDADLGALWSRSLGPDALGFRLDGRGILWVVDRTGASAVGPHSETTSRVEAPSLPGMNVAALTFVDDDLIFAYQHDPDTVPDRPALVRLTRNGTIRWSTRLSAESITFERDSRKVPATDVSRRLVPDTWVCGYLRAGALKISGDALLAVYSDMPRTGLAIGYVVSLIDGTVRYT